MKNLFKIIIFSILVMPLVYSAPFPTAGTNPYYTDLNAFTIVSLENSTGRLTQGINASFYNFNVSNYMIVLGNINITLNLNVTGEIYLRGQPVQIEATSFNFVNNLSSILDNATILRTGNISNILKNTFQISNYSAEYALTGFKIGNYSLEYASTGYKFGNLSSDLASGSITQIKTTNINTNSITVNQQLIVLGNITNANITNININGSIYPSLDALFDFGNGTLRWKNANFSGNIQANSFIGDGAFLTSVQQESSAYKLTNFTSNYDARADRFTLSNYSTEYASTGYKLSNFTGDYENKAYYKLANFTSNLASRLTELFTLGNYSSEYASTGYKLANFTSNLNSRLTEFFNLGNYSAEYASTGYKLSNFTSNYDNRADRFTLSNYSSEYSSTGYKNANFTSQYDGRSDRFGLGNYSAEYSSTGFKISNGTSLPFSNFRLSNLSNLGNTDINSSGSLNISGQIQFLNLTIANETSSTKTSCSIFNNGSGICICSC